ncbi:MAG: hypothetical protein WC992_05120 [Acholeplasmataceae bacterium]|jgi:hypothetical protein
MGVHCWREEREEVLAEIWGLMREAQRWEWLLPFRTSWQKCRWIAYAQRSWFFPMFEGRRFGGYVMVSNIADGWGEIHFGVLPWVGPFLIRAGARKIFNTLSARLTGVEAYIPTDRPQVARLARLLGFENVQPTVWRKVL